MFPPELPPVSNRPLYVYRILGKLLCFFIFGLGTVILLALFFPPMRLFIHPRERFQKYGRRLISSALRGYVSFMHILGVLNLEVNNREKFRHLSSKIVVANHPSLLDVVMLLSLIPNADCIVNTYLKNNIIVKGMVRQFFILNTLDSESVLQSCLETLRRGNCLIIFPEGTRTPRTGKAIIKKGAARVALASGCNIVPVHIGGNDKYGLGKKEPMFSFNPRERYIYSINMGTETNPEQYRELPAPRAVRALIRDISAFIFPGEPAEEN